MPNGENIQALAKNLELIRFVSILLLLIHFYSVCFPAMLEWGLAVNFVSTLLYKLTRGFPFLAGIEAPKLIILAFLFISLYGHTGKKDNKMTLKPVLWSVGSGAALYFLSGLLLSATFSEQVKAVCYMGSTTIGYLLLLRGGAKASRMLTLRMGKDIFNIEAETFPQEQRLLENEYSINLPAQYRYKGQWHSSVINIISPTRALLVLGVPGSG
ncbi:MAG TPA: YWFCY domain-containing protein [Puia sp.]|uniref:YWFCY domain-containing protein n=1 Tax=Puia sp. TaxID=2045100 RepID=UPI002CDFB721|nr:YWFCY domain-containing protein [Puia sp.]HVU97760.1 YWFCY domain-containing protein [Puia sp.]